MRPLVARLRRLEHASNGRLTPLVSVLLALVSIGFLACIFTNRSSAALLPQLAVTAEALAGGQAWRLLTAPFANVDPLGFLVSLMVLGFFGAVVEKTLGARAMILILLASAIAGAGLAVALGAPYFGFRGSGYVLLAAFAAINPKAQVLLLVFPVPAWLLVGLLVFIDVATAIGHVGGEQVLPHVLGVGFGVAVIQARPLLKRLGARRQAVARERAATSTANDNAELDRLLEKVSSQGLHSLTKAERKFLDRCSKQQRGEA